MPERHMRLVSSYSGANAGARETRRHPIIRLKAAISVNAGATIFPYLLPACQLVHCLMAIENDPLSPESSSRLGFSSCISGELAWGQALTQRSESAVARRMRCRGRLRLSPCPLAGPSGTEVTAAADIAPRMTESRQSIVLFGREMQPVDGHWVPESSTPAVERRVTGTVNCTTVLGREL